MDFLDPAGVIASIVIGLVAGLVGGMAGIGGSIIMLPALALWFGYDTPGRTEHHAYMAAAMCVNAVVAFFSARKHAAKGAVHTPTVTVLLPAMIAAIVAGVLISNQFDGTIPKLALVVFILGYCVYCVIPPRKPSPHAKADPNDPNGAVLRPEGRSTPTSKPSPHAEGDPEDPNGAVLRPEGRSTPPQRLRLSAVAALTGFAAGFLGIGGGIILVPLLQVVGKIPLRRAIAASATVMIFTAPIGAALKLSTLHTFGIDWLDALALASLMAIGAVLGARAGATLTHSLRLPHLKLAIALILAAAAVRMAANSINELTQGTPAPTTTPAETPDLDS
ncbi:MAG: sulfite exporter TauE/SafE family protein [Phycisphaerales bacterium JB040]